MRLKGSLKDPEGEDDGEDLEKGDVIGVTEDTVMMEIRKTQSWRSKILNDPVNEGYVTFSFRYSAYNIFWTQKKKMRLSYVKYFDNSFFLLFDSIRIYFAMNANCGFKLSHHIRIYVSF